jgi:hypothetical protein
MKYRDLKNERDAAVARALEAERLSMKSEFERVTEEFEKEKARLTTEAAANIRESYLRGFSDGSDALSKLITGVLLTGRSCLIPK